jgi:hypothetical protein
VSIEWDIRRAGRAWPVDEAFERFALAPERIEMTDGRLLLDDEGRLALLALLLENVGADAAVRLGNPSVWRQAVNELK